MVPGGQLLSIVVTWKRTEQTTRRKKKKKMTKKCIYIYVDWKIVSEARTERGSLTANDPATRSLSKTRGERDTQLEA